MGTKYQVNHRCEEKTLAEMTDAELEQVIARCPVGYSGASTQAIRYIPHDIMDEWESRHRRRKLLAQLQQGAV